MCVIRAEDNRGSNKRETGMVKRGLSCLLVGSCGKKEEKKTYVTIL